MQRTVYKDKKAILDDVKKKLEYLVTARPTAVNIKIAADDFISLATKLNNENGSTDAMKEQ